LITINDLRKGTREREEEGEVAKKAITLEIRKDSSAKGRNPKIQEM